MNSYSKSANAALLNRQRQHLEVLLDSSTGTTYQPSRVRQLISQLGQTLVHWLAPDSTPRISKSAHGDVEVWRVYDPVTSKTLHFSHEDALRVWLEGRYYHQ